MMYDFNTLGTEVTLVAVVVPVAAVVFLWYVYCTLTTPTDHEVIAEWFGNLANEPYGNLDSRVAELQRKLKDYEVSCVAEQNRPKSQLLSISNDSMSHQFVVFPVHELTGYLPR